MTNKKTHFFFLLFIFILQTVAAVSSSSENKLFFAMQSQNMLSVDYELESWNTDSWEAAVTKWLEIAKKPTAYDKRNKAFKAFASGISGIETAYNHLLIETWRDLNLFTGKNVGPGYVAKKIALTQTIAGEIAICTMIMQPTAQTSLIHAKQNLIKRFETDTKIQTDLSAALTDAARAEYITNSLFDEFDFPANIIKYKAELPFPFGEVREIRNNPYVTSMMSGVEITTMSLGAYAEAELGIYLAYCAAQNLGILPDTGELTLKPDYTVLNKLGLIGRMIDVESMHDLNKSCKAIVQLLCSGFAFYGSYKMLKYLNSLRYTYFATHFIMLNVAKTVAALDKIHEIILQTPEALYVSEFKALLDLYDPTNAYYDDYQDLLGFTKTATLQAQEAQTAHFIGRTISAASIFTLLRKQISNAIACLGYADAYLGIALKIKESKNQSAQFCYVSFDESAEPKVMIDDFWHPIVDQSKAVTNNLELNHNNQPHNIIVTGPNAGGKSTAMKAATLCIWLGQTIGIAPAAHCSFTPFDSMSTYLNVTDNIGDGQSLFKAEVIRAQELIKGIETEPNQKHFVVFDEVFNGTSPKEGTAAAYAVAEHLGKFKNSICLIATHFDKLTELESKTSNFRNLKVAVDEHNYETRSPEIQRDTIGYRYKLEPGVAHQNVALKIIEQEGVDNSIVQRAHEVLREL